MSLKKRLLLSSASLMVSLLLNMAWLATALAESPSENGDGLDGDEVVWPILAGVGGLLIIGLLTYFVIRSRRGNANDGTSVSRR